MSHVQVCYITNFLFLWAISALLQRVSSCELLISDLPQTVCSCELYLVCCELSLPVSFILSIANCLLLWAIFSTTSCLFLWAVSALLQTVSSYEQYLFYYKLSLFVSFICSTSNCLRLWAISSLLRFVWFCELFALYSMSALLLYTVHTICSVSNFLSN
jgi:hypothetical protein